MYNLYHATIIMEVSVISAGEVIIVTSQPCVVLLLGKESEIANVLAP